LISEWEAPASLVKTSGTVPRQSVLI
jgi:hypothetical protein